ncbi:hypothetical protein BN1708_002123 [Verticillium longisporum]|uniref:Uncharacterized protein n=1 Tax=Verticillium longisporum TaxID=100787 RepID=A0A0G4KH65_VERLO|nr:hypothetical protein BN1708_002123 [Verticillium longisporum]
MPSILATEPSSEPMPMNLGFADFRRSGAVACKRANGAVVLIATWWPTDLSIGNDHVKDLDAVLGLQLCYGLEGRPEVGSVEGQDNQS